MSHTHTLTHTHSHNLLTADNRQLLSEPCGSHYYACPEIILGVKYDGRHADVWSSGVTLYAMLTGKLPFQDDNQSRFVAKLAGGVCSIPHSLFFAPSPPTLTYPPTQDDMPRFLPTDVQDLIRRILVFNPKQRITIEA